MAPITETEAALRILLMARRAYAEDESFTATSKANFAQFVPVAGQVLASRIPVGEKAFFEVDGFTVTVERTKEMKAA